MDKLVLWFKDINKDMIPQVGGKGANLGEMINHNFPVPDGFVITSDAYTKSLTNSKILKTIEEIEKSINVNDTHELNTKSKEIRDIIANSKMDIEVETQIRKAYLKLGNKRYVAVRSSATAEDLPSASFAGQQDTYLNIKGENEVVASVKKAWGSLFNSRAIFYRRKQDFPIDKVKIAIVVQEMINSEKSGIMFTANPINSNKNELVIEAGYGLGESIVSGSITPDTYVYDKNNNKIIDKIISKQVWKYDKSSIGNKKVDIDEKLQSVQKIEDYYVVDLAKIGINIENHYKKAQDIEWALEKDKLYIVQSRPITTIKENNENEDKESYNDKEIKVIVKGLGASSGVSSGPVKKVFEMVDLEKVVEGDILVTSMTTPDMVPAMRKAKGIVTEEGGVTSHAAIVSRELGIPAIVGTQNALKVLNDGDIITVNATKGEVYLGNVKSIKNNDVKQEEHINNNFVTVTKVKVNVALPEAAKRAAETNADGIGLLRAEHLITSKGVHPIFLISEGREKELKELVKTELKKVLEHFKDKIVYYRTFDARTDEFKHLKGGDKEPKEDNPMLGAHGIRRSLNVRKLIEAEFIAIKELILEGFVNIGVMIPFTQNVKEYVLAKKIATDVGLVPHVDCLFGIMVETPGAALTIDSYVNEKLDFVSFGTNDLTQLTLGIDRNNEKIQEWFSELHPAILYQIRHVIDICSKNNVTTSICGQAGSNPEMVKILVEMGIDSVSCNIDAVSKIKNVVYETERKLILDSIRKAKHL